MDRTVELSKDREAAEATPVLEVRDLVTVFHTDAGPVRAVDGVSLSVAPGETLGIVGESGSGKSVTALSVMRLLDEPARIEGGTVRLQGRDVLAMSGEELRRVRGDRMAMVFQDPMTSLNPVLRIARQLTEAMTTHGRIDHRAAEERAVGLLGRMGITAPKRAIASFPHQFSGGMRQRVMLAMGFANEPALLIADEPTTALDVTIQAQILELIAEIQQRLHLAVLLVTHDLGVVAGVCDRVAVMHAGQLVECADVVTLFKRPLHPYTQALVRSIPRVDRDAAMEPIPGVVPSLLAPPPGCRYADRCPSVMDVCRALTPSPSTPTADHVVACHAVERARAVAAPD